MTVLVPDWVGPGGCQRRSRLALPTTDSERGGHRGGGDHRAQPEPEERVEHAGGDRDADARCRRRRRTGSGGCCASWPGDSVDRGDHAGQRAGDQGDVGGLDRHVGAGADGEPDVGLGQGGGVVDAVADHRRPRLPSACSRRTSAALCSGRTSASTRSMPTWRAIAAAVRALSPVIMTTSMPRPRSAAIAAAESSLTVSATASTPAGRPSTATRIGVLPSRGQPRRARLAAAPVSMPASVEQPARCRPAPRVRRPVARTPLPVIESKLGRRGQRRGRARAAPATIAAPSGCSRVGLGRGDQAQQLVLVEPAGGDDVGERRLAAR